MAAIMAPLSPLSVFHVAGTTTSIHPPFTTAETYQAILRRLATQLDPGQLPVLSYALLPRQWHIVVGPCDPQGVERWLDGAELTQRSRLAALGPDAHEDLIHVCRHVERLALELGLVRRAQDWPWSSLADRLRPEPVLPIVPAPFLGTRAWVDYVNRRTASDRSLDFTHLPRRLA